MVITKTNSNTRLLYVRFWACRVYRRLTFLALIMASFIYAFGETTFHAQSTNYITMAFAENKGRAVGVHGLGGSLGNIAAPIAAAFLIAAFD